MKQTIKVDRLPCRGCRRNCLNYTHCGGTPWRQDQTAAAANKTQMDSNKS